MDYSLRDLKFFQVVAEYENIGRAAEALGRTQPAITKCIQRLEAAAGSPLLFRQGRGIRLTPTGQLMVEKAGELLRQADQVQRELHDFSLGHSGHVRMGTGLSAPPHVIPAICANIIASSGVKLDVLQGANIDMRQQLRDGTIDLLFGLLPSEPEFDCAAVMQEHVTPAVRAGHPLLADGKPSLSSVLSASWALPTADIPSRQWWDQRSQALGLAEPDVRIQVNSPALLPGIAERSDLVAFFSNQLLRPSLRALPLPRLTMKRRFGVAWLRTGYLSPAAKRTRDHLADHGAAYFAQI